MTKPKILIVTALLVGLTIALPINGCSPATATSTLKVATSTYLIAQIVERVGGSNVEVANIIPPAQCPGHFDVKPGDIQKLADADLFILHGWQGETFSQDLIVSADNPDLRVASLNIQTTEGSNWMVPSVQREAVDKITVALAEADPQHETTYQQLATEYKEAVSTKEAAITSELSQVNLSVVNVICAEKQAGFVNWVGLNLVSTYGRPDSLTPQVVRELVDTGRSEGVTLIIDNLQSGQDAGAAISEELDCRRIILSNVPGGFPDTETWEKAIDHNIELILPAVAE
jgi:zinc transport system substrate-binding protein